MEPGIFVLETKKDRNMKLSTLIYCRG